MKENDKTIIEYFNGKVFLIENIFNDFFNYICTIARNSNYELNNEDIEEIVNDVILTVWNNKDKLDINKKMSSYIAGITKNLIKKKCRNYKRLENIDDYENKVYQLNTDEIHYFEEDCYKEISKYLEKFKEEDKSIFIYYYYDDFKIKDIASLMNMSESKVKSKLFRVRNKLKKYLKG